MEDVHRTWQLYSFQLLLHPSSHKYTQLHSVLHVRLLLIRLHSGTHLVVAVTINDIFVLNEIFFNVSFQGAGSALMGRFGKFEQIVRGMNYVSI